MADMLEVAEDVTLYDVIREIPNEVEAASMKTNGVSKTSVKTIRQVERQCRAVELRVAGRTLKQIADVLGYASPSGAAQAIEAALRKRVAEPVDHLRDVENARLDAMWTGIYPAAKRGNLAAIDRAIKIMTRRAKLLGLDLDRSNAAEFNPEPVRLLVERVVSGTPPTLVDPAA